MVKSTEEQDLDPYQNVTDPELFLTPSLELFQPPHSPFTYDMQA